MVLCEVQRELLFEGKRWFDLIRRSRRDGNTTKLIGAALTKYTENQSAIRSRLSSMDAIFWPVSENELKVNPLLKQNPAYINDVTSSIEKN